MFGRHEDKNKCGDLIVGTNRRVGPGRYSPELSKNYDAIGYSMPKARRKVNFNSPNSKQETYDPTFEGFAKKKFVSKSRNSPSGMFSKTTRDQNNRSGMFKSAMSGNPP